MLQKISPTDEQPNRSCSVPKAPNAFKTVAAWFVLSHWITVIAVGGIFIQRPTECKAAKAAGTKGPLSTNSDAERTTAPHLLNKQQVASIIPIEGISLRSDKESFIANIRLDSELPVRLDLKMSGPGTDWAIKGSESAVLSVQVDGAADQDVVLWAGVEQHSYPLSLGDLGGGNHVITLTYAKKKSTAGAQGIDILSGSASVVRYDSDLDRYVDLHAPILIGRRQMTNNHSDTPLALYYQIARCQNRCLKISYGYVFSNEDGGDATHPARQQARWGRLTDIQHVFTTTIDADGKVVSEQLEGAHHVIRPFNGRYDRTHPIIMTCTLNNNVTDKASGPLRFRMPPEYLLSQNEPMGELMRKNYSWFSIMNKELEREGKIMPDSDWALINQGNWRQLLSLGKMPDPRRYVYVQYNAVSAERSPIAVVIILKDGRRCSSDFDEPKVALGLNGWNQTAVLLPLNLGGAEIAKLTYVARGDGGGKISEFGHIFMLNESFLPFDLEIPLAP